jgi:1-acyl-sn-glycerol-3-phosphate acyltransferase
MAQRSLLSRLWYQFLRHILRLFGVLFFSVRHFGRENIPKSGAVLVVSNHQSHFDPPLVGIGSSRRMNYLARDTLFRFGPFGWLIHSVDAIPIDREGLGLTGLKEALRRLERGEMVLIFPEGTRTRDGRQAPFHPGFTVLAARTKAAILPVGIEGAFDCWPRRRKFPLPGTIHVRFGPPIFPEDIAGRDERELVAEIERRVSQCRAVIRQHPLFDYGRVGRAQRAPPKSAEY